MIVSELYLAWSLLLLFQSWLEARVLESLLLIPAMIASLIKGLLSPHKPSLSFPTLSHGAVVGESGSQDLVPLIPVSRGGVRRAVWLLLCSRDPCASRAARDNIALVSFSSHSLAQANVTCHVQTLSLPKCISYTVHVTLLNRKASLSGLCVPLCVFISVALSIRL